MFHKLMVAVRKRLEKLDYRLQRLPVGRGASVYDRLRGEAGLTLFRQGWWLHTRLESYGCMRRYAHILDWAVANHATRDTRHATPDTRHPTRDTRHPTRLILLRMGHLGDLIHLMPAVREMRRQRPEWRLELITGPWNRELVEQYDLFDAVHYWTPDVVQFHRGNREGVLTIQQECKWIETLRGTGVDLVFCPSSPHFCELPVIVGLRPGLYVGGEWKLKCLLKNAATLPPARSVDSGSAGPARGGQAASPLDERGNAGRANPPGEPRSADSISATTSWGGEYKACPFNSRHYEMDAIGDFLPLMGLERPELKLFYPVGETVRTQMADRVSGDGCRVSGDGCRVSEVGSRRSQPATSATLPPSGRLPLRGDATCNLQPATHHLALIFPGSGWPGKNWPPERFAALGNWLAEEKGMRIGLGGAPGERDLCKRVAEKMQQPATLWAGQLTLDESAALIEQASLVVGNDSAPIHMAAALDVPTVSLWGPTFPEKWAPKGQRHMVVKAESCAGCTYWHPRARCKGRPACMEQIELEDVQRLIEVVRL